MDKERMFPVLNDGRADHCPKAVPWSFVEPWRASCLRYHSQTLERLAERGGLSAAEMRFHHLRTQPDEGSLRGPPHRPDTSDKAEQDAATWLVAALFAHRSAR